MRLQRTAQINASAMQTAPTSRRPSQGNRIARRVGNAGMRLT